jgi:nucleoside phosphorylase
VRTSAQAPSHPPGREAGAGSRRLTGGAVSELIGGAGRMVRASASAARMKASDIKGKVDFGVLTIREDEFAAVLERLRPFEQVSGKRAYNVARVELGEGGSYLVAVIRCTEQGTAEALDAARDLLEDLAPGWLLVVGIAGGVPSDDFTLGDVVVSTRFHDFSVEAVLQDRAPEYAMAGGPLHKKAGALAANLKALEAKLAGWSAAASIGVPRPPVTVTKKALYGDKAWREKVERSLAHHASRSEPVVVAGAIASSDRLIKDTETLAVWLKVARHVVAVEMEAAGVYRAAHGRQVPVLAIRGISDVVGFKRDPGWTRYACHTAAAFTLALLRSRPVEPKAKGTKAAAKAPKPKAKAPAASAAPERRLRVFVS